MYIIGRGGFGKVWKVRLKKADEYFALKEMSKVKIIDRRSEISIMSERNLLSNLHHTFIVNMHFAFQDFYNLYLVMDLLTGGDLRYHIAHKRTFSEIQTKFIISNMILALEYIHNKNIIHRDIKPENLVLESNGYVRITDFGVAKINEEDNSSETSGTPGYMAPEVILVQNHSFPSDFFALGVIGYEFMLGFRPYLGRGRKEIKQLIISKQAKLKIDDLPDDWSNESMDFINQLLQRKPKKRLGYNGIEEIKNHPWMRDIDWEELLKKNIEAPFIPPMNKENFDKKYCEGEDNVGEETIERYELYLQSDLYGGVFANYTYMNLDYISKLEKKQKQKYRISSSNISDKIILYNNNDSKNYNKNNTIKNKNTKKNNKNDSLLKENNKEIKVQSNRSINSVSVRNSNNSQRNSNININYNNQLSNSKNKNNSNINNNESRTNNAIININLNNMNDKNKSKSNFNTIEVSKNEKNNLSNYDKFSINNIEKFHTPMVNENIMCNNYINLNFNNCADLESQTNKKNDKIIDVSTIKKILSNHIEVNNNINNINNNYNIINNQNSKNANNINKKKDKISVNKSSLGKYTLNKSSSMKLISGYHNNYFKEHQSPVLVKPNNNNDSNTNTINVQKNIHSNRGKTNININNSNSNTHKITYKTRYDKKHYQTNASNPMNLINNHQTINTNHHVFNRGKSEYNLKIDTNDMNILSRYNQRHKNRMPEKSFTKTSSCDRIIMNNNNYIKNKNTKNNFNNSNNKKTIQKDKIKSTIDFDKKLMFWIHKNFRSGKQKKTHYNSKTNNIYINKNKNNVNKNKFSRHESLLNINGSNFYNNNPIKNKNFPCINSINSINMSNSPIKKIFELNLINSNTRQLKSNRSNFNTINSTSHLNKVQSVKNIHSKNKVSKFQKMLNPNPTFTPFSYQRNKKNIKTKKTSLIKKRFDSKNMNKKKSTKDLFNKEYNNYNINFNNYKPRNLKIESIIKGIDSKNDNNKEKMNLEYNNNNNI